jgi:Flp pilus assembly protein TadD
MRLNINQALQQAVTAHNEGKFEEAEKLYRSILEVEPKHAATLNNLGIILKISKKLEEAEVSYRKAIELKPDYADAYNNLGNMMLTLGKFEEAEENFKKAIELNPKLAEAHSNLGTIQNEHGKLDEAETSYRKAIGLKPDFAHAHNNLGNMLNKLGRQEEAELSYRKVLKLKPDYVDVYFNLGNVLYNLGKLKEAAASFKKATELKPNYVDAHYNLGNTYHDLEKYQEAIDEYSQVLELDPKNTEAQENFIFTLDYFLPNNKNTNPIIVANNDLKKIANNFTFESEIKNIDLANLFKKSNKIIKDNIGELTLHATQIYRKNSIELGCKRHKGIFNKYNIIPKFCFSCFKIQIEPKNVLELCKLYLVFDKIKLPRDNTRKCTIEVRPNVSGTYKGLIYCSSNEEVNETLKLITPIVNKFIINKMKIKRGCSEYVDVFPDYGVINKKDVNFMKYKDEWEEKEKIFDNTKNKVVVNNKNSLGRGISVSDVLIINNWLNYAKKINDLTYKDISEKIFYSDYISKLMSEQLDKRKNEYLASTSKQW